VVRIPLKLLTATFRDETGSAAAQVFGADQLLVAIAAFRLI